MQIYHYDDDGLYVGESAARTDPLEQKLNGKTRYLIPRNATSTPPPPTTGDNEAVVFKDGSWSLVDDYRGAQHWLADGTAETITELGVRPVALSAPDGELVRPHWDGAEWIESATVEEQEAAGTDRIKAAERRVRDLRVRVNACAGLSILEDDQAELATAEADLAAIKNQIKGG